MVSEHLFFITERVTDILKLEEEIAVECLDDDRNGVIALLSKIKKQRITKSMEELREQLSRVVVYLRHVEQSDDEQQHDHDRFYLELFVIANSSDDILNHVISNDDVVNGIYDRVKSFLNWVVRNDTASVIYRLVNRTRNSHRMLPSETTYNFITGGNTNWSGQQIIGPTTINMDPSHSRAPMTRRAPRPKSRGKDPVSDLVGFNHEIQTLLYHLTQDSETRVVAIVGMAGLGKTTLAKHIYHHQDIKTRFTPKIWVCISQSWDETSILNAIWRQAAEDPEAREMGYDQAVDRLSQLLSSKSCLVILDDIWSVDAWHYISQGLPPNSGSKVVVTTRNISVAKRIGPTVNIIEPETLDDEKSCELFKRRAFLPDENISDELLPLGEEMVKKCKGLPLAIVALAGILRMDRRESSWQRVSETLTKNILKANDHSTQGVVKEILALSYNELPHQLKQCVLYLRFFPEDYEINARNLMKMWIAECLTITEESQVYTAEEYLDEIVQRYIVEVVKTNFMGQVSRIQIHDLIRQMFVDIDKERGFLKDSLRLASSTTLYGDEQNCNFSSMSQSERIANVERVFLLEPSLHIRSVIFLNRLDHAKSVLQSMVVKFRLLRVLILCDIHIIPEEIGNLIHLRYFELRGNVELPGSIGNLRNLWTLNIRNTMLERRTEINLCKLKELTHLYLPNRTMFSIDMEKLKLERLEKLKTLWNVVGGEWMLLGMTRLSAVLEELRVHWITSEEQLEVVFRTPSISNNLQTLELDWNGSGYSNVKLRDMNILRECKSLKKLKLCGQIQASTCIIFPPKLIKLHMRGACLEDEQVMNIISESCPHLKILKFGFMAFRGEELVCNANSFGKLVKLTLDNLKNLKMWKIESSAMPNLHCLTIRQCQNLDLNPEGWTRILKVPQLTHTNDGHVPVRNFNRTGKSGLNLGTFGLQYMMHTASPTYHQLLFSKNKDM